jgi:hypothetical protein
MSSPQSVERLYELLTDEATVGLSPGESAELETLLKKWPHIDRDAVARTVAEIDLTISGSMDEELPDALRASLLQGAKRHLPRPVSVRRPLPVAAILGWAVAACLLVGITAWQFRPVRDTTLAERQMALAQTPGTAKFTAKPGGITAEVVWNESLQTGYLQVKGLPVNSPPKSQYQLWIIDGGRGQPGQPDANNRVDGGVFDVAPDGTAIVPIRAALKVFQAQAFAITEEPPGGVIVSRAAENLKVLLEPK